MMSLLSKLFIKKNLLSASSGHTTPNSSTSPGPLPGQPASRLLLNPSAHTTSPKKTSSARSLITIKSPAQERYQNKINQLSHKMTTLNTTFSRHEQEQLKLTHELKKIDYQLSILHGIPPSETPPISPANISTAAPDLKHSASPQPNSSKNTSQNKISSPANRQRPSHISKPSAPLHTIHIRSHHHRAPIKESSTSLHHPPPHKRPLDEHHAPEHHRPNFIPNHPPPHKKTFLNQLSGNHPASRIPPPKTFGSSRTAYTDTTLQLQQAIIELQQRWSLAKNRPLALHPAHHRSSIPSAQSSRRRSQTTTRPNLLHKNLP